MVLTRVTLGIRASFSSLPPQRQSGLRHLSLPLHPTQAGSWEAGSGLRRLPAAQSGAGHSGARPAPPGLLRAGRERGEEVGCGAGRGRPGVWAPSPAPLT